MKYLINLVFPLVFFSSCRAQNNDTTTIKPKIDIKVNKEFDDNGNLKSYDSTYTYTYSSQGNSFQINNGIFFNDSIFNNNFIFDDSLLNNNFNNPFLNFEFNDPFNFDIIDKQMKEHLEQLENMLHKFQNEEKNKQFPNTTPENNNKKNDNNTSGNKVITL
jgi:hypothetical protein